MKRIIVTGLIIGTFAVIAQARNQWRVMTVEVLPLEVQRIINDDFPLVTVKVRRTRSRMTIVEVRDAEGAINPKYAHRWMFTRQHNGLWQMVSRYGLQATKQS